MTGDADPDAVVYFAGLAQENGPARGLDTLFVVGDRPLAEVRKHAKGRRHVALGACHPDNRRAPILDPGRDGLVETVRALLDDGLWVTVEYPADLHEAMRLRLTAQWRRSRFIPQPRVWLPSETSNQNMVLKLDQHAGGMGGSWNVVLSDLERAWFWTPARAAQRHTILARARDLIGASDGSAARG